MLQTDASISGIQIQEMTSDGKIALGQSAGAVTVPVYLLRFTPSAQV